MFTRLLFACLLGTFVGFATDSYAEEQRCKELGANCVCSEPLNTNSYSLVPGTDWGYNPADSTTKECAIEGFAGGVIEDNAFRYTAVSSGEAINALPAGHTNTWILRTFDGAGGQFIGTQFPTTPTARIAFRGYRYWSSTYSFTNQVANCENSSKIIQFGNAGPILDGPSGSHQLYSWTNTPSWFPGSNPPFDCCWFGPGPTNVQGTYTPALFRGKWFRFEVIVRNTTTTGQTIIEIYRKNVTDNTAEQKIIDTSIATSQPVGDQWTQTIADNLSPGGQVREIWFDLFRRDAGCTGFVGMSHITAAAWSTDAGQRIGAAVEIEGGTGSPPSAPTGLTFQ